MAPLTQTLTLDPAFVDDLVSMRSFQSLHHVGELARQPVHTVYGGAHLFSETTFSKLTKLALEAFDTYVTDPMAFAALVDPLGHHDLNFAESLCQWVRHKLLKDPIEDYRIDFEDGFGVRSDDEEDRYALEAAKNLAILVAKGDVPPHYGIRIKDLSTSYVKRAVRTLDLFVTQFVSSLRERGIRELPGTFLIVVPKILGVEEAEIALKLVQALELKLALKSESLKLELMVEAPKVLRLSILDAIISRLGSRLFALHLGAYDLMSAAHVVVQDQSLDHPLCEMARLMMVAAAAETGVAVVDGATTIMPVGPFKTPNNQQEIKANQDVVFKAWSLSAGSIRAALRLGIYQGWDLHPAQIPIRYGVLYAFFHKNTLSTAERLKSFLAKSAQATLKGTQFDDRATGHGLINFFLRAVSCGALTELDIESMGFKFSELKSRSFS